MDVELIEIREFLAAQPPFDELPAEALDRLPAMLSIRYLRRGTPFPPTDADLDALYIVRKGTVELREANGELIDKLGEGDLFIDPCQDAPESVSVNGLCTEDTLLYLLPCERFRTLRTQHPRLDSFFHCSAGTRLKQAMEILKHRIGTRSQLDVAVGELITRPPVHAPPHTSLRAAAALMSRERVSALLIMEAEHLTGIITDRDLRSRCLAAGLSAETPVSQVMTRHLHRVSHETPAFEAMLTMMRLGIHHLPVIGRHGVEGMVSTSDLVRQQSTSAVYLVSEVRQAESVEELRAAAARLPELQVQLVAADTAPYHIGQAISAVIDAITTRLLVLAETTLGAPPVPYAWLACGSQARHEQSVHTDQDNALLLDDSASPEDDEYFAALARFVNDGLAECGFSYCPGEVMARTAKWRQPLHIWKRYFDDWIDTPEPKALMHASIFFDLRAVYGNTALCDRLRAHIHQRIRDNSLFLAYMAANALHYRPPLGFFRHFVLVHDGEHDQTLDLKGRGLMPIIDLARVHALAAGLPEQNTFERLRAASDAGVLSSEGSTNLLDAYGLLTGLRARHQARQLRRGESPDNFVRPDELTRLEREHLKDAFAVIRTIQEALAQRYQSGRFS